MFELVENAPQGAVIKVVGVGGGGGNAVKHMIKSGVQGVEFICANTDAQALQEVESATVLQIGAGLTKGLGAGADPDKGQKAAIEDKERIKECLAGADMIFITAGMGGGTGTGAAPVVASIAKEMGILTVAVVTRPFIFEGGRRSKLAAIGLSNLEQYVDSVITIPNDKLLTELGDDVSFVEAFQAANNVLHGAVQGIADLVIRPGLINVDFADVKTVMSSMGKAMMGSGIASGKGRAEEAANKAIKSPLLDNVELKGATGVLVNITAGENLTMKEFSLVGSAIEGLAADDAQIVIGTAIDPDLDDEMRVTVVVTGLGRQNRVHTAIDNGETIPSEPDFSAVNKPLFERNSAEVAQPQAPAAAETAVEQQQAAPEVQPAAAEPVKRRGIDVPENADAAYLDVPAFLRRQAD